KPADHYWGENQTTDTDGDGWLNGHTEKWAEAIRKADGEFNFAAFDPNHDGILAPHELGILIVIPQNIPFGSNRGVVGREVPLQPLVVDGVTIGTIAEAYIGNPPNHGVVAHELSHLLLGLPDMYVDFFTPTRPGSYSLMDGTYSPIHL